MNKEQSADDPSVDNLIIIKDKNSNAISMIP